MSPFGDRASESARLALLSAQTEPAKAFLIGRDLYVPRTAAAVLGPFTS